MMVAERGHGVCELKTAWTVIAGLYGYYPYQFYVHYICIKAANAAIYKQLKINPVSKAYIPLVQLDYGSGWWFFLD